MSVFIDEITFQIEQKLRKSLAEQHAQLSTEAFNNQLEFEVREFARELVRKGDQRE